jgi:hypothetical protein
MVTDTPCKDAKNCNGFLCICDNCGAEFCVSHANLRRHRVQFCNRACAGAAKKQPTAEKFWSKVNKNGPIAPHMTTPCWLWTGYISPRNGYGELARKGETSRAHRISWELHYGPIPDDLLVCHICDVRHCVRPDHFFLGTYQDNRIDAVQKGRAKAPKSAFKNGIEHPNAKLSSQKVTEALERFANGESQQAIAKSFGVTRQTIHKVLKGQTWKHINP